MTTTQLASTSRKFAGRTATSGGVIGGEYVTKRAGRYRCGAKGCRKDFSTISGTVMEQSHVGLSKWLWVFYMMCSSKKGISTRIKSAARLACR